MTRVLVVDDDPQILRALKINLAARGYIVLVAPDGTQALHIANPRDIFAVRRRHEVHHRIAAIPGAAVIISEIEVPNRQAVG